jgi:hypothetical protein
MRRKTTMDYVKVLSWNLCRDWRTYETPELGHPSPDRESIMGCPKCEAGVPTTDPQLSVLVQNLPGLLNLAFSLQSNKSDACRYVSVSDMYKWLNAWMSLCDFLNVLACPIDRPENQSSPLGRELEPIRSTSPLSSRYSLSKRILHQH